MKDATEMAPREQENVRLARLGYTNNEIGARLSTTRNAVRYHLKELHSKLETGGERSRLVRGWTRAFGILSFPVAKFGVTATAVAFAGGIAILGVAAYQALPGGGAQARAPETFEGSVLIDGRYPNGCPAEFNAGTMTLEDFAHGNTTLDQMRALNPDLPLGYLPPETIVKVPYDPDSACQELEPTPPGSPQQFGTPPASG